MPTTSTQAAVGEQLSGGLLQRGVDFRQDDLGFVRVGELVENFARLLVLALEHESARRFRNEEQQQHEQFRPEWRSRASIQRQPSTCTQFWSPSPPNFLMK